MLSYDYDSIDWRRPFTKDNLDMNIYDKKFELLKRAQSLKLPNAQVYRKLLNDKTLRIYTQFSLNDEYIKLYPYQDVLINDPHRFKIFRAANQIGKSFLLDTKAADNLIMDHGFGHNEAIVSGSLKQATYQMLRVKEMLYNAKIFDWQDEKGEIDNMSMITYDIKNDNGKTKYTNKLIIAPAGEGLLGFDLHQINLDEIEFWKDVDTKYFINQIAEPRLYHTKGGLSLYSNPNGQDSYVADLEKLRLPDDTSKYHTYVFNYLDKPGNTQHDLDLAMLGKTRAEIESTLLAIRTLSDRNFFTPDEIERSHDKNLTEIRMINKQPFFFLDVGAKHDQSVLIGGFVDYPDGEDELPHIYFPIIKCYPVGYPISRVVGSTSEEQDSDGWHVEKSVKEYITEWSKGGIIPLFGVDVTGNSGISPLFETVGIYPEDITFSGPSKSGYYQRFKWYMEKGLLHRSKSDEFDYQARHLEMKRSQRGYMIIHHENENDLDDVMDSVAGCIYLMDPRDPCDVPVDFKVI